MDSARPAPRTLFEFRLMVRDMRLEFFKNALREAGTVKGAARLLDMDRGNFYRDFRRDAGISAGQFLREHSLGAARR